MKLKFYNINNNMSNSNKDDYRKYNLKIKKKLQKSNNSKTQLELFIKECNFIKDIITDSILSIDNKKNLNIFSDTDSDIVYTCLNGLHQKISKLLNKKFFFVEVVSFVVFLYF